MDTSPLSIYPSPAATAVSAIPELLELILLLIPKLSGRDILTLTRTTRSFYTTCTLSKPLQHLIYRQYIYPRPIPLDIRGSYFTICKPSALLAKGGTYFDLYLRSLDPHRPVWRRDDLVVGRWGFAVPFALPGRGERSTVNVHCEMVFLDEWGFEIGRRVQWRVVGAGTRLGEIVEGFFDEGCGMAMEEGVRW